MTSPRVAIVSLVPDPGHLTPLLRIGAVLQGAGLAVRCLLPDESAVLSEQFRLPVTGIGDFRSGHRTRAARTFGFSPWRPYGQPGQVDQYLLALSRSASHAVPRLRAELSAFAPNVLLADPHGFRAVYARLADHLGVPLVLHVSGGAILAEDGMTTIDGSRPVSKAGRVYDALDRARRHVATFSPKARSTRRALELACANLVPAGNGRSRVAAIASGLALTELARFGRDEPRPLPGQPEPEGLVSEARRADIELFGPVFVSASEVLPSSLTEWLSACEHVIYLSFGTMVRPTERAVRRVRAALASLDIHGLWTVPASTPREFLRFKSCDRLRFERRLPQTLVLQHPAVRVCVTHAGASTVQESLVAGKPLLCVPACWDQFHNAALVEALGVGLRLDVREMTEDALVDVIGRLLAPHFADAASRLASELVAQDGPAAILDFWFELLGAPPAKHCAAT